MNFQGPLGTDAPAQEVFPLPSYHGPRVPLVPASQQRSRLATLDRVPSAVHQGDRPSTSVGRPDLWHRKSVPGNQGVQVLLKGHICGWTSITYSVHTFSPTRCKRWGLPVRLTLEGLPYRLSHGLILPLVLGVTLILSRASGKASTHFPWTSWHNLAICQFRV